MQETGLNQSAGAMGTAKIASESACVVYHSETGAVVHIHRVASLEGATVQDPPAMEARAIELALSVDQKRDRSKLRTLSVDPGDLATSARYKVDLRRKTLVEVPRSRPLSQQAGKAGRKRPAKRKR